MINSTKHKACPPSELLTKNELAKRLKLTTRTIDNLTNKGVIKRLKLGASSRYNWDKTVEAIEAQ